MGATKIQGGPGEPERELKAEHVGVTHSALLGKHASLGPIRTTAVQIWNHKGKTLSACPANPLNIVEAIRNRIVRLMQG